jgi:transcriptional regulator with XRE-family HTH domain
MRVELKKARKKVNLTLAVLARLAGVSESYLSRLESGSKSGSVHIWDRLEGILGVRQQELRRMAEGAKEKRT